MTLGLILHLLNSIKFKNHLDIWFEFVPRIIFLWSTFGYLMIIIFVKWNTNYFYPKNRTNQAPGLLNVMINMFLGGPIEDPLFAGQEGIEKYVKNNEYYLIFSPSLLSRSLIIIALICVPLMFFPKPLILHLEYKARKKGIPSIWALFFRYYIPNSERPFNLIIF